MQLRHENTLVTASDQTETIVPASQAWTLGPLTLGETNLLYIARGTVQAGIDFNQLETTAVQRQGGSITVARPAPQILSRTIDMARSRML